MDFRQDERLEDPGFGEGLWPLPSTTPGREGEYVPQFPDILPSLCVASVGASPAVSGQSSAGQSSCHIGPGVRHFLAAGTPAR